MSHRSNYMENKREIYKDICNQIKDLTNTKQSLANEIITEMINEQNQKEMWEYGTFSVGIRKKYKYSDEYTAMKNEFEIIKLRDEQSNDWDETPYLIFRESK